MDADELRAAAERLLALAPAPAPIDLRLPHGWLSHQVYNDAHQIARDVLEILDGVRWVHVPFEAKVA